MTMIVPLLPKKLGINEFRIMNHSDAGDAAKRAPRTRRRNEVYVARPALDVVMTGLFLGEIVWVIDVNARVRNPAMRILLSVSTVCCRIAISGS